MIIELTENNGKSIFINKNKIVKFCLVEANLAYNKVEYTEIQMESCFLNVKESPLDIVKIINK